MRAGLFIDDTPISELGVGLAAPAALPLARRVVEHLEVPGREGTLTRQQGWEDRELALQLAIQGPTFSEQARRYRALRNLFDGAQTIRLAADPTRAYHPKSVVIAPLTPVLRCMATCEVRVVCDPFAYLHPPAAPITLTSPGYVTNPGDIPARLQITVHGAGKVTVTIGGKHPFTLTITHDYLTVDSALMECHKDGVSQNQQMTGPFPRIEPGRQRIDWSGNVTQVVITPNWRTY